MEFGHAMRQLRRAGECLMPVACPGTFALSSPLLHLRRELSVGKRQTALNTMFSSELFGRALLEQDWNRIRLSNIRSAACQR